MEDIEKPTVPLLEGTILAGNFDPILVLISDGHLRAAEAEKIVFDPQ